MPAFALPAFQPGDAARARLPSDASLQAPLAGTALMAALLARFEASIDRQASFEALRAFNRDRDRPVFLASDLALRGGLMNGPVRHRAGRQA